MEEVCNSSNFGTEMHHGANQIIHMCWTNPIAVLHSTLYGQFASSTVQLLYRYTVLWKMIETLYVGNFINQTKKVT